MMLDEFFILLIGIDELWGFDNEVANEYLTLMNIQDKYKFLMKKDY